LLRRTRRLIVVTCSQRVALLEKTGVAAPRAVRRADVPTLLDGARIAFGSRITFARRIGRPWG
jgi:hypothetical protein